MRISYEEQIAYIFRSNGANQSTLLKLKMAQYLNRGLTFQQIYDILFKKSKGGL
jgi:hypothetical protein